MNEHTPASQTAPRQVADVMSRAVVGIGVATPRGEIVSALRRFHVSAVPVIDGALRPIGVVSEADMVAAPADDQAPASNRRRRDRAVAADLMTAPAVTISASAPLMEAARLMGERHVRRLVAVHSDGRVAGIVSRHDLLDL
jgi:CBS domain-containing protein